MISRGRLRINPGTPRYSKTSDSLRNLYDSRVYLDNGKDFDSRINQGLSKKERRRRSKGGKIDLSDDEKKRLDGEIEQAEYAAKRVELQERQAGIRAQLEASIRVGHEIANFAIKAFELSQSLEQRWVTAKYKAKRTILSILLETVRLNSDKLEFSLRTPFEIL